MSTNAISQVLVALTFVAPCVVQAQRVPAARFPLSAASVPRMPDMLISASNVDRVVPLEPSSSCDHTTSQVAIQGAVTGALVTAVFAIVFTPVLAVASIGTDRDRFQIAPILVGGAAVGAVLGVVSHRRRCG